MNVYILSSGLLGMDSAEEFWTGMPVAGMIGLKNINTHNVSGYFNSRLACEALNIPYIEVGDYSLQNQTDKEKLLSLSIDVLLVLSWQRLVPRWLLDHCRYGALGFHGSPWGISGGRGRSPQNWALLLGKDKFFLSMFALTCGIDDGNVHYTRQFDYSVHDDIRTGQHKASLLMAEMIRTYFKDEGWNRPGTPQNVAEAYYLPQRRPEDGAIDWRRSASELYNFVRALARPYPGAFSADCSGEIRIWHASPFHLPYGRSFRPGEVLKIFSNNDMLVGTGGGIMLVDDYSISGDLKLKEGLILESVDYHQQMERIIRRHQKKYPDLPIQPEFFEI